jgi:hypothetical protein
MFHKAKLNEIYFVQHISFLKAIENLKEKLIHVILQRQWKEETQCEFLHTSVKLQLHPYCTYGENSTTWKRYQQVVLQIPINKNEYMHHL